MNAVGKKSLTFLFTLVFAIILCGAVSAATDHTQPTVKAVDPVNKVVNVATNKVIKVTFSEPIKARNTNNIALQSSSGTVVPTTKSISGNVLTIKHASTLKIGTKYYIIINTGSVKDLAGNPNKPYLSTFTTTTTKLIDSGVTYCRWFPGSKYYWKTYLINSNKIVISSHFYNPNLNRQLYQTTTIKPNIYAGKRDGVCFIITPKNNGKEGYINVSEGFTGTILQYYWTGNKSMNYWNYRTYMIQYAPNH